MSLTKLKFLHSLGAGISLYVNAVSLNRISEGYGYDGINISRQVMAG